VRRVVRGAAASDYKCSALVQAVVKSDQFRMRRVPTGRPAGAVAGTWAYRIFSES
jgi:hypothetical protein